MPSGASTSFRPPRFRIEIGTRTVMVRPSLLIFGFAITLPSCFRPDRVQLSGQVGQSFGPQPDVDAVRADIDALDQQLDDARLLGREQFVPERIEPLQRLADLGFGRARR